MVQSNHDRMVARGRSYVLGLLDEGWYLDDFRQDDISVVWTLYHIRNNNRGVVEVNEEFLDCVTCQRDKPICGYFAVNGYIKSLIQF